MLIVARLHFLDHQRSWELKIFSFRHYVSHRNGALVILRCHLRTNKIALRVSLRARRQSFAVRQANPSNARPGHAKRGQIKTELACGLALVIHENLGGAGFVW